MDYTFASRYKGPRFKSPGGYLCETGILLLVSSHQAVYCYLGPHEEEIGEEPNTDSQPAENDPIALWKKTSGHPSKLSDATLDLMEKKLKKNPTLTLSQMKMRMSIEKAATGMYTGMMNKLLFKEKNFLFKFFCSEVSVFYVAVSKLFG